MSDQQSQPTSGETGTLGAAPAVPDMPASNEPVTAAAEVEAARLAPDQEETSPKADAPKVDAVSMEAPKVEAVIQDRGSQGRGSQDRRREAGSAALPRQCDDHVARRPRRRRCEGSGGIVRQAPVRGDGCRGGAGDGGGCAGWRAGNRRRRKADGGEFRSQASAKDSALETSVARLDAEIVALKASLEHNSKTTTGQINKASDRLDKVEKAQAEPAAKLAKLSETVDKLRAAQASRRRLPPRRPPQRTLRARYRSRLRP